MNNTKNGVVPSGARGKPVLVEVSPAVTDVEDDVPVREQRRLDFVPFAEAQFESEVRTAPSAAKAQVHSTLTTEPRTSVSSSQLSTAPTPSQ